MAKSAVARLTVASSPTTIADIISPFIVAGGREGAIVNVVEASPENVYSVLQTGMADVAIGTRVPPSELNSVVIGHAYLWAQFPVGHPLSGQDRIEISDLMSWPLIVLTGDHGVRRMFDSAVAQHGLSYTSAFETESPHVAQALAAAGRGICILSDDSRFDLVSSPIGVEAGELTITLFGVWDPVHFASSRIVDCLESLRKFVSALYPQRM
jgi:DNA-binding transcriptional LysR family regulator